MVHHHLFHYGGLKSEKNQTQLK